MQELYLNHAGTSWPKPPEVQAASAAAFLETPQRATAALRARHERLAKFVGTEPEHLLLTPGCTSALHLAIADFDWRAGDEIVLGPFEHLAVERPARALKRRGVGVRVAPPGPLGTVDLEAVEDWLRAGRVRLIAISAASNVTGDLMPWRMLASLAHRYGAFILLDAAQTVGWLDLDVTEVDLCAFGSHKGVQGPWGLGGLYVGADVPMASPRREGSSSRPSWCDAGSVDRVALAGVEAGLGYLEQRPRRLATARTAILELQTVVDAQPALRRLGAPSEEARMPTLALTSNLPSSSLARRLAREGIIVGAGQQCAPLAHATLGTGEDGCLRISIGPSTSSDEVEAAARMIRGLAKPGP